MRAFLRLFVALCGLSLLSAAQTQPAADKLIGLWGVEQPVGPLVRGELTIDARTSAWRASIAGYEVPVQHSGDKVGFVLPGNAGELRAHFDSNGKTILGNWIQPANFVYYSPYASPVELHPVAANVWRGEVVPFAQRVSFYLSVQRAPDGSLSAFIRNPEFNHFRRRTFTLSLHGNSLTLAQQGGTEKIEGTYDLESDTVSLPLLERMPALKLTRRNDQEAIGFFPRVPPQSKYEYREPLATNDGWPVASLSEVGLDPGPITAWIEKILNADLQQNLLPMQSLLIARHGKLAFEEYFYGFDRTRPHDTRSAGKTWSNVLVGVARMQGTQLAPETPVFPLFSDYKPFANEDVRKSRITLRDLMTFTSGLACDDSDDNSPGNEDTMQSQSAQPDWYKYTLDLPMATDPGGKNAIYCSADINLVGGVVHEVTHQWLPDLFHEAFALPLQISDYHLNLMPTKEAYFGGGFYMRPRDQLKLAQLYLDGGVWHGKRIVGKDWVQQSLVPQSGFKDPLGNTQMNGLAWHNYSYNNGGHTYEVYFAGGNGGQVTMLIPDLDMAVTFNGGAYGEGKKFFQWQADIVPQVLIPAALKK